MRHITPEQADALERRLAQQRIEFEDDVDGLLGQAWRGGMSELAAPVRYELEQYCAPSGKWRDLLGHTAYRPLDFAVRLFHDFAIPKTPRHSELEGRLYRAAFFEFAAILANQLTLSAESNFSYEHSLLAVGLVGQAEWFLSTDGLATDKLRPYSLAFWNEHTNALLTHRQLRYRRSAPYTSKDLGKLGDRWAPLKMPVVVAAISSGNEALLTNLLPLLDEAAALYQLSLELDNLNRDLSRGSCSYPIACLMDKFGIAFGDAPEPSQILLAAFASRTLPTLAQEALQRGETLLSGLDTLGLAHLRQGLEPLLTPFQMLIAAYQPASSTTAFAPQSAPALMINPAPQLVQVLKAAESALCADPNYREAWEIHRWGFLNAPYLVASVFPACYILEQRLLAGHACGSELDSLFTLFAQNRFHYYNQPCALPPDCDTIGLMLRLAGYANDVQGCREGLETALSWLLDNVPDDGLLPTYLMQGVDAGDGRSYLPNLLGQNCAAVQCGLLLGLLSYDSRRFAELIVRCAKATFDRFVQVQEGAFRYYDTILGVEMLLRLIEALRANTLWQRVQSPAEAAVATAIAMLHSHRGLGRVSCQNAAVLILCCHDGPARGLFDPEWVEMLLRTQHTDGLWDACPVYILPNRGNLSNWYSSKTVTTALCFHALTKKPKPYNDTDGHDSI